MKQIIYLGIPFFLLLFSSCYRDLGNYDYTPFPEMKIDSVESNYGTLILFHDTLKIDPVITFGEEGEEAFDCRWYIKQGQKYVEIPSEGAKLRYPMNIYGAHNFLLKIRHKKTNIFKDQVTSCRAESEMSRGWYLLKETPEGNTEVDGWIRRNVTEFELNANLISRQLGAAMEGAPVDIDYCDWQWTNPETKELELVRVLRPASEKDINVFYVDQFKCLARFDDLFFTPPSKTDLHIEALVSNKETTTLIHNGRIRAYPNTTDIKKPRGGRFVNEMRGDHSMASFIGFDSYMGTFLAYDSKNSSFMQIATTASTPRLFLDEPNPVAQNADGRVNKLDSKLLYIGFRKGGVTWPGHDAGYIFLKKNNHPDSLVVLKCDLNWVPRGIGFVEERDTILPRSGNFLHEAKYYAQHFRNDILYFTKGSKVYGYNLKAKEELIAGKHELLDFPGEEITYIKYLQCSYDDSKFNFEKLIVATYAGGQYKLYLCPVTVGLPEKPDPTTILTGEGRLKSLVYAAPTKEMAPLFIYAM